MAHNPTRYKSDQIPEVVVLTGYQNTDTLQNMINQFNTLPEYDFTVRLDESSWDTQSQYQTYVSKFESGDSSFDIITSDVTWTAGFGYNGWLLPLDDVFPVSEQTKFIDAQIKAATFGGNIYAVPWFHDSGLLYYRSDILEAAYNESLIPENRPPETWQELHDWPIAIINNANITSDFGSLHGFVWQGKSYEGLMCDFMEYLGGTGQTSWLTNTSEGYIPNFDTQNIRDTLTYMKSLVDDGVSPSAVLTYAEENSRAIWNSGDAVFHRNWPYAYRLSLDNAILNGTNDGDNIQNFGVAPMPSQISGDPDARTSALGGWQISVNQYSEYPAEAKEFVMWLTSEEQQLTFLAGNGNHPTRLSAYNETKIIDAGAPDLTYIVEFLPAFQNAIARPVHPIYSKMSEVLWSPINSAISGSLAIEDAITTMTNVVIYELDNFPPFYAPYLQSVDHSPKLINAGDVVIFTVDIEEGQNVKQVNLILATGETHNITMTTTDNITWTTEFNKTKAGTTALYQIQIIDSRGDSTMSIVYDFKVAGVDTSDTFTTTTSTTSKLTSATSSTTTEADSAATVTVTVTEAASIGADVPVDAYGVVIGLIMLPLLIRRVQNHPSKK